jgi:hypothetical protein
MPSLHHMFRLMRSIIMLNDTQVCGQQLVAGSSSSCSSSGGDRNTTGSEPSESMHAFGNAGRVWR